MNISLLRTFHMEDSQAVNLSEPCLFVNKRETPPQPTSRKAAEDLERLTCQNGSFGRNSSLLAVAAQQTYTPWAMGGHRQGLRRSLFFFAIGHQCHHALPNRDHLRYWEAIAPWEGEVGRPKHDSSIARPRDPSTKSGGEFQSTNGL